MIDRVSKYYKNLSKKRKKSLACLVIVFCVLFCTGISMVYAFYHDTISFPILANQVGNFEGPRGDMSIMLYKQTNELSSQSPEYARIYSVPQIGYEFDHADCSVPCTDNQSDACHYTYDINQNMFTLTSDKKVNCRFYFNKTSESDINIYIMAEDNNGGNIYNGRNYREYDSVPAFGYEYAGYSCAGDATVTYDSELKTFNIETTTKNTCYAYFNSIGAPDVVVNVYTQTEINSNVYTKVDSIPTNKAYILSTKQDYASTCLDTNGVLTEDTVSYSGGYISVSASGKRTCTVYLDLYEGAPLIESMSVGADYNSLQITGTVVPGNSPVSCYKYKIEDLTELTECLATPVHTFDNLNECTYYKVTMYAIDENNVSVGYTKTFKTKC